MSLFERIENNDLQYIRNYLVLGGNANITSATGSTLLHEAVYFGNLEMIQLLLSHGASVQQVDAYGNTPMHVACIFGNKEAAQALLNYGAEIDSTTEGRTWTPLMLAINESYTEMAEWLIKEGANLNHVDRQQGWTPLLVACDQGLKDMSLQLIKQGVNVDVALTGGDARGRSAIHLVSYYGEVEIIEELIQKGVDVNKEPEGGGLCALHWAVYNNHMQLFQYLLEQGADVNKKAAGIYRERTPLHYTFSCQQMKMAEMLLDFDADPLMKDSDGKSPLDLALARYKETHSQRFAAWVSLLESYI